MTIDNLLNQFDHANIKEVKRDDEEGKAFICFNNRFTYMDDTAKIVNFIVLFDSTTKIITAIKIYGYNLESIAEWVRENGEYLWCPVVHYMTSFDSFPSTILLLCSL